MPSSKLPPPRRECVERLALCQRNVAAIKTRLEKYARVRHALESERKRFAEKQERSQARAVDALRKRAAEAGEGGTAA